MSVYVVDKHTKSVGHLPGFKSFVRTLMDRYGVSSIDVINVAKVVLSVMKRYGRSMSIDEFYGVVDSLVDSCISGGAVDIECIRDMAKGVVQVAPHEPEAQGWVPKEVVRFLSVLRLKIVDYCMSLGDRESIDKFFDSLFKWLAETKEGVFALLDAKEAVSKGIDYAKLVKESRW